MVALVEAAIAFPYLFRAGDLLASIMLFMMTTSSLNYDLYFFAPALQSFDEGAANRTQRDDYYKLQNFLLTDFTIEKYASEFKFSNTETANQFFFRFLKSLESQETIPQNVRDSIVALQSYEDVLVHRRISRGFIKPCPIFILTRIVTLLAEFDYGLKQIQEDNHEDSVNTVIEFLTEDFDPSVHGEGLDLNNEDIGNIVSAAFFGFTAEENKNARLVLTDGVQASTKNKQFFEHILPKVPEEVKQAINTILPYL